MPTTPQSITTTASRRGYTATVSAARFIMPDDGSVDEDEKHDAAALGLARKLGWSGQWFRGALGDGAARRVYVNAGVGGARDYSPRAAFVVPDATNRFTCERLALRRLRYLSDLTAAAKAAGSHFFEDSTMAFFSSKLVDSYPLRDGSALFVTSERDECTRARRRAWTVRRAVYLVDPKTCAVRFAVDEDEAGFQGYSSKAKACGAAKRRAELVNIDPQAWAAMMASTGWPEAPTASPIDYLRVAKA